MSKRHELSAKEIDEALKEKQQHALAAFPELADELESSGNSFNDATVGLLVKLSAAESTLTYRDNTWRLTPGLTKIEWEVVESLRTPQILLTAADTLTEFLGARPDQIVRVREGITLASAFAEIIGKTLMLEAEAEFLNLHGWEVDIPESAATRKPSYPLELITESRASRAFFHDHLAVLEEAHEGES